MLGILLDALVDRLAPRVADLVLERIRDAEAPSPQEPAGLVDKQTAAQWLGISVPTLDRHVRAGAPVHQSGARRRFYVAEVRAWIEARGRRAAAPGTSGRVKRAKSEGVDDAEIVEMAVRSGFSAR